MKDNFVSAIKIGQNILKCCFSEFTLSHLKPKSSIYLAFLPLEMKKKKEKKRNSIYLAFLPKKKKKKKKKKETGLSLL